MKKYYETIKILNESTLSIPENWEIYEIGPETPDRNRSGNKYLWVFYEGGNDWQAGYRFLAVYAQAKYDHQGEMSRIWIEIKYPPEIADKKDGGGGTSIDIQKLQKEFGKQIADKWISKAKKLRVQHASEKAEYSKIIDEESKKFRAARDKGLNYTKKDSRSPKYDGNWVDAFIVALQDKEIKPYIRKMGIDRSDWKENNTRSI